MNNLRKTIDNKNLDYFHKELMVDLVLGKVSVNQYCVLVTRIANETNIILNSNEK